MTDRQPSYWQMQNERLAEEIQRFRPVRMPVSGGERRGRGRSLTDAEKREARRVYQEGLAVIAKRVPLRVLADRYGVSISTIFKAVNGL
ncbi:hypothetical protein [Novosphingopyxis sp. YJ-S2-01]|uniref:hypothetical protein n=1 Tax=Novosphingopyxis sp. YJ-S2-01 TaxID=2794021 RepID=UPI0018DEC622|nr:hypothetical protein [Novosphingopyxis sp. YJ-S2-01]MBH9537507.1 hypothetical protein [Novosphingopyxis sp. YJ-S2-01]